MVTSFVRLDAKAASSSASTLNRKLPSGCSKPAGKARSASACSEGSSPSGAVFPTGSVIACGCFLSTAGEHTPFSPFFRWGARAGAACRSSPWNFRKALAHFLWRSLSNGAIRGMRWERKGGCGLEKRLGERGRTGRFAGRPLPLLVPFRKDSRWPDGTRSRA